MGVKRALKYQTLSSTEKFHQPGDKVLVWRQKFLNKRMVEWLILFKVLSSGEEKRLLYARDAEIGAARPFNVSHVELYFSTEMISHCSITELAKKLQKFAIASNVKKRSSILNY